LARGSMKNAANCASTCELQREFSIVNSVWIWYFVRVSVFWPRRTPRLENKQGQIILFFGYVVVL
jgi:hypothetical protein